MANHPIIFQGPLVRAILDGRKTQTRRPVTASRVTIDGGCGGQRALWAGLDWYSACAYHIGGHALLRVGLPGNLHPLLPRIRVGDRLWVREAWALVEDGVPVYRVDPSWINCAREQLASVGIDRWRPSIHMPRWAARIWLEVTSVRFERVENISEADAEAEGVEPVETANAGGSVSYRLGFLDTWARIYGTTDGWCLAYTFAVLSTTGEPRG